MTDKSLSDKAIEILQRTRDGEDLSPRDLKLVEMVVNDWVNEAGEVAFEQLYQKCTSPGGYKKSWYWGIENLTNDHEGYVYWRDKRVEHFSHKDKAEERTDATKLAARCRQLDREGKVADWNTVAGWSMMDGDEQ